MGKSIERQFDIMCYTLGTRPVDEPLASRWSESVIVVAHSPLEALREVLKGTRSSSLDYLYTVRWEDEVWLFHRKAGEDV